MGQMIGAEMISVVQSGTIRINGSYSFSRKWSAGAEIGITAGRWIKNRNSIDEEHREALGMDTDIEEDRSRKIFNEINIYADYWPKSSHDGLWLRFGGTFRNRASPDITIGVGYAIPIYKGFGADLRYQFEVIDTYKTNHLPSDGIRGGFHYVF